MTGKQSAATERALAAIRRGTNPHAAARAGDISPSTIYRALARARKQEAKR